MLELAAYPVHIDFDRARARRFAAVGPPALCDLLLGDDLVALAEQQVEQHPFTRAELDRLAADAGAVRFALEDQAAHLERIGGQRPCAPQQRAQPGLEL